MVFKIKNIIALVFAIISIICSITIIRSLIWGKPDKISAEWQSQLLFLSIGIVIILCSGFLSFGIFYLKKWSFYLYNFMLAIWIIFLILLFSSSSIKSFENNIYENIIGILLLFIVPILIDFYFFSLKKHLK